MEEKDLLEGLALGTSLTRILEVNQETERFGVTLTKQEAKLLLTERKEILKKQERVEFGEGILVKLMKAFCDSPYIWQDNYLETLERLMEIFYFYKNETLDELTDDELLTFMKEEFDGECEGSLDYLEDTCLDRLARGCRRGLGYPERRR